MCRHCRDFAAIPTFLDAASSDVVAILYACTAGLTRSAHLHARSIVENLVRHFYFDSQPSLFVARHLNAEDSAHDRWADLFSWVQKLPHFCAAKVQVTEKRTSGEQSLLFDEIQAVYQEASRHIHGATPSYRSLYEGIQAISLDEGQAKALGAFLQRFSASMLQALALYHIGPYLLISQPIRKYMLGGMRSEERDKFLRSMENVPLDWARHHRAQALIKRRERRRSSLQKVNGLLLHVSGRALIVNPDIHQQIK